MFLIQSETRGTFYKRMTAIGPREEAAEFEDGFEALAVMRRFPMTVLAQLVNGEGQPCDVTGKVHES